MPLCGTGIGVGIDDCGRREGARGLSEVADAVALKLVSI